MIYKLLRLPSSQWEIDLETGVAAIDDYLKRLDAKLLGTKSVRRVTLLEARDFLLEASETVAPESRSQAIERAVQAFGVPAEIAHVQRRHLKREALKTALSTGSVAGIVTMILWVLGGTGHQLGWPFVLIGGVITSVCFGLCFGILATYNMNFSPGSIPRSNRIASNSFLVENAEKPGWGLFALFLASIVLLCLFGILGWGWFESLPTLFYIGVATFIFILNLMPLLSSLFMQIAVTPDRIHVTQWYGQSFVAVHQITGFTKLSDWYSLLWPLGSGTCYRLVWREDGEQERHMILCINPDHANGDVLIQLLEKAVDPLINKQALT